MSERIIELLINNELAVSELYRECAESFPEEKEFWMDLSREEVEHAENIRSLTNQALKGNAVINEKAFFIRPLEISIEYAKEITQRVKKKKIGLVGVLSLAVDIENSLIESEYYKVFTGKGAKTNLFIKEIHMESMNHRERIVAKKEEVLSNTKKVELERWD